jgi:putative hydrolase of the HAD superfamily
VLECCFKEEASVIKDVFFDFYNTLVGYDPPQEVLEARVLRDFGIEVSPEVFRRPLLLADEFIYGEHARLPIGKRPQEERLALYAQYHGIVLKEAGIEASSELIAGVLGKLRKLDLKLALFGDVMPSLTRLRELGQILGLISNVDRDISPVCQELGLSALLGVVVTSQESGFSKPQPEIFLAAVKQAGVKPAEAIYVGDQYQIDVVGANGAGMLGILLDRHGYFEEITDCPKVRSLAEVTVYLGSA